MSVVGTIAGEVEKVSAKLDKKNDRQLVILAGVFVVGVLATWLWSLHTEKAEAQRRANELTEQFIGATKTMSVIAERGNSIAESSIVALRDNTRAIQENSRTMAVVQSIVLPEKRATRNN